MKVLPWGRKSSPKFTNHPTVPDAGPQQSVSSIYNNLQSPIHQYTQLQQQPQQHAYTLPPNAAVPYHSPCMMAQHGCTQPVQPAPQMIQCLNRPVCNSLNDPCINHNNRHAYQATNQQYQFTSPPPMTHALSTQVPTYQNNQLFPSSESGQLVRSQTEFPSYTNRVPCSAPQSVHQNQMHTDYYNNSQFQQQHQQQQQQQHHQQQQQPQKQQQPTDSLRCSTAYRTLDLKLENHSTNERQHQFVPQPHYLSYHDLLPPQTRPQSQQQPRSQAYQPPYSNQTAQNGRNNNVVQQEYQNPTDIAQDDDDLSLETQCMLYNERKEVLSKFAASLEKDLSSLKAKLHVIRSETPSYIVKVHRI